MKLKTLILSAILLSLNGYSQESERSLSVYSNFNFEESELILKPDSMNELQLSDIRNIGGFSIGFEKQINGKWSREFLIQNLQVFSASDEVLFFTHPDGAIQVTHGFRKQVSSLGLGMEANRKIGKGENKKVSFRIGGLASLGFEYTNLSPSISTFFQTKIYKTNINLDVVPRVSYKVNQRCDFNFSAFLPFAKIQMTQTRVDNPRIALPLQRSSVIDQEIFNLPTHFRFGLTYKLAAKA